ELAREVGRDLHRHQGFTSSYPCCHFAYAFGFAHHAKGLGVDQSLNQLPAFYRVVFVQDDCGHMLDVVVQSVTKSHHLDQRGKEHEEERQWITQDHDELFVENRVKTAQEFIHRKR